jgi:hypothetical protein
VEDPRQQVRPAPLVNSGEWQSFEVRMRRRRVERLIVRAEVALAEGNTDEVRDVLSEMRGLDPGLPQIAALEAKLADTTSPPPAPEPAIAPVIPPPSIAIEPIDLDIIVPDIPDYFAVVDAPVVERRGHALLIAAASLMMAAAGAGTYWFYRSPQPEDTAAQVTAQVASAPRPAMTEAAATSAPVLGDSADVQVETVEAIMVEPLPAPKPVTEPPAVEPQAPSRPANDEPAPRPLPAATSGISVPLAQSTTPIEPPPAIPEPRRDIPVEARNVTPAPLPDLGAMAPTPERSNEPLPARASDDAAVRGILGRYAEAYSRLDASAAQEIWPAVNRSALSRAFDGLASQQVSLERCDVDVHGGTARAICAGSATWAPKVGNGNARTEPRNWTFQLAKAGTDWQIVSARVQQPQNK